jgi:hypothetical protein
VDQRTMDELQDVAEREYVKDFHLLATAFQSVRDRAQERGDEDGASLCQWELEAFSLVSSPQIIRDGKGEPLTAQFVMTDGTRWPDITAFPKAQFDYFYRRFKDEKNPLLKVRYAEISYEHGFRVLGINRYELSVALVPLLLWLFDRHIQRDDPFFVGALHALDRATVVGLSMKNTNSLTLVCDKANELLGLLQSSGKHRWSLEVSELLRAVKKGPVSDLVSAGLENRMITVLQEAMQMFLDNKNYHLCRTFCTELMAWRKIRHEPYRSLEEEIGQSFEHEAEHQQGREEKSALVRAHFLEMALQHYANIGGASSQIERLKVEVRNAYEQAERAGEFKTVSTEIQVDGREVERTILSYLEGNSVEDVLNKVARDQRLFPNAEAVRQEAEELAEEHPLLSLFPFSAVTSGRKVAQGNDDEERKRFQFAEHYMLTLNVIGRMALVPLFGKLEDQGLTASVVMDRIRHWPEFDEARAGLLEVGLERYFAHDYVSAVHVLVPQVEAMLRHLFRRAGYAVTRLGRGTAQQEVTLNEFLAREDVKSALGENYHCYLQVVLVDQLGLNLRNAVAHGLIATEACNMWTALLIIHQIVLLTNYSVRPPEAAV